MKASQQAFIPAKLAGDAQVLANGLPALLLDARKTAASLMLGAHGRRRAGMGEAFWQHREHLDGETMRQVDWRRSARSDRLFVREMERESPASLQIWVDTRPSMLWRNQSSRPTKAERALVIALALAMAAKAGGERVSTLLGGQVLGQEEAFLEALITNGGRFDAQAPIDNKRPSQILIVSDGLEPVEIWVERLRRLSTGAQHVLYVLVCDPDEEAFPFEGRVSFMAPGSNTPVIIGQAGAAREAYRRTYRLHVEALRASLSSARGQLVSHATDQPALPITLQAAALLDGRGATSLGVG
ncbi:MAG: DUF58 domain-containing protein [Alphaproteobacteria bacterium PA3]|nr:MAG: DUF58 domain-containing protein [Alphaproteobacteria bacterium PA3]